MNNWLTIRRNQLKTLGNKQNQWRRDGQDTYREFTRWDVHTKFLFGSTTDTARRKWQNNIKINLRKQVWNLWIFLPGPGYAPLAASCEHGNEPSVPTKGTGYPDYPAHYQLLNMGHAPRSYQLLSSSSSYPFYIGSKYFLTTPLCVAANPRTSVVRHFTHTQHAHRSNSAYFVSGFIQKNKERVKALNWTAASISHTYLPPLPTQTYWHRQPSFTTLTKLMARRPEFDSRRRQDFSLLPRHSNNFWGPPTFLCNV
jgi:hypothetical protein